MDRRIALGLMVVLMLLVVTAAYAPNPGTEGTTGNTGGAQGLDQKISQVLSNQQEILAQLKMLKEEQDLLRADVKYVRSKVH